MPQRRLVDETVVGVVADLVERDIEAGRVEGLPGAGEHFRRPTSRLRARSSRAAE